MVDHGPGSRNGVLELREVPRDSRGGPIENCDASRANLDLLSFDLLSPEFARHLQSAISIPDGHVGSCVDTYNANLVHGVYFLGLHWNVSARASGGKKTHVNTGENNLNEMR